MYYASDNFQKAMLSPLKTVFIKLELFDYNMNYIKEITKQVKSDLGTLAIDGSSAIRRSFKLTLDNSLGEFIFGEDNLIWINKRIKLYIGLQTWSESIEYIPLGVFILTDPEDNHTLDGKDTTINAVDKAYLMTDKRGKFINELIIATGANIANTVKTIASGAGETLFNFDDVTDTVPYELTYSGEDNRWDAIKELADLAKCTVFYDVDGYLRLKKIDLNAYETEPITWEYKYGDANERLYAGNIRRFNETNLANHIRVLGGNSDTVELIYDLVVDEDDPSGLWVGNPYSIQQIGRIVYMHNNNSPDPLITTNDSAKFRAKYELMNRLGFAEDVTMTISPNYLHDVDDVIWIEDLENGITGNKYLIKSISMPLAPSAMTIEAQRYRKLLDNWDLI